MGVPSFEEMFNQAGLGQGPAAMAPQQPGLGQQAPATGGGWNDAVASRSNSLTGMGLGMMGGGWAGGMQGYDAGAKVDATNMHTRSSEQLQREHMALQRQQMAQSERLAQMTGDIKEYQYAKSQGFQGTFQEWTEQKADRANKQYGNVQQVYVPDDNAPDGSGWSIKMYQPTSKGDFKEAGGLPPGSMPAQVNKPVQTENGIVMMPQRLPPPPPRGGGVAPGGAPPPPMEVPGGGGAGAGAGAGAVAPGATSGGLVPGTNPQAMAAAKARGTAEAKTQMSLPDIESNGARVINRIDSLISDPALANVTGMISGRIPEKMQTPEMARAQSYIHEIQGADWLVGIQQMRGMGALSNMEGQRVSQARNRLTSQTVSTEDYKTALRDLRELVQTGVRNARLIASGQMRPHPYDPSEPPIGGATTGGSAAKPKNPMYNPKTGAFE